MSDALGRYLFLRAAKVRFHVLPWQLDEQQQVQAGRQADREQALIERVVATPEAEKLAVADESVAEAVLAFRADFADGAEFDRALKWTELDEDALRVAIEQELHTAVVLEDVADGAEEVADDTALEYYRQHRDRMQLPEMRTVHQILITINPEFAENRREAALERVNAIAERLRASPQSFPQEALQNSECPSALNGGLLGTVPKGTLFPALDEVLFAMSEGEISGPIETELGFHLLWCAGIQAPGPARYEQVADRIKKRLTEQRRQERMKSWLAGLSQH